MLRSTVFPSVICHKLQAWHCQQGNDLILQVRIQPRASRDEFAGILNHQIKIRITAAATDNQANKHLIDFLAKQFRVGKNRISITQGSKSRNKTIRIEDVDTLPTLLQSLLTE